MSAGKPKVLIVGAGFGGLAAARILARAPVDVTVVDRRNFHLFQPLLYQVATAGLNPSDIAWPIRSVLRDSGNTRVLLGEVCGVDAGRKRVKLEDGRELDYDFLILATGATHNYFGHDDWASVAPGLKRVDDATLIRRRVLLAFERAENTSDAAERKRLMTFAIVGAGPTGVEMAGAIAELAQHALAEDFRAIDPRDARIVLIEGGERVLSVFPPALSAWAQKALEKMRVEVWLRKQVTAADAQGLTASGERLDTATVLWAAGIKASPAAQWLGIAGDRAGRVPVQPDLSVAGHDNIFVIGDTAAITVGGKPVPGVAPAAKQAGKFVARLIGAVAAGKPRPPAFRYFHYGNFATIGRNAAVIDFGFARVRGFIAWAMWAVAHVYFLIGTRNRLLVALQWLWSYVTFSRGARLIVGSDAAEEQRAP